MPRPANELQYELAYKYFDGHLQLECPEITLRSPSELVAKGVGVFRSSESGQLQLDAQINVDVEYMRKYATGGRVGALMPIEKTMVAEGEMEGSLRFHTGVLDISIIVFMGVSPQEYRPDYVTISGFQSCFLDLTLGVEYQGQKLHFRPLLEGGHRETRLGRPYPLKQFEVDHLIVTQAVEEKRYFISIRSRSGSAPSDQEQDAMLLAIGYVAAERLHVIARFTRDELTLYRKLRRNTNWFYPPILHHSDREPEVELTIIRKLFKYLLNDNSGKLRSILEVYTSISYSPVVGTHALLLATLIEGLLKMMEDDINPEAKSEFESAKRMVLYVLNEDERVLDTAPFIRLRRVVEGASFVAKSNLYRMKALIPSLSDSDTRTFGKVRNRLAHGDFSSPYTFERDHAHRELDETSALAGIFHKLLLSLIGYSGPFTDYGIEGWPQGRIDAPRTEAPEHP